MSVCIRTCSCIYINVYWLEHLDIRRFTRGTVVWWNLKVVGGEK